MNKRVRVVGVRREQVDSQRLLRAFVILAQAWLEQERQREAKRKGEVRHE